MTREERDIVLAGCLIGLNYLVAFVVARSPRVRAVVEGRAVVLARDARALQDALRHTSQRAVEEDGAQAIVIGGGPLVRAANAIAPLLDVPLVEPVAAAVRRARALCAVPG